MIKCQHCQALHDPSLRFCPATGKLFAPERFFSEGTVLGGKYRLGPLLGVGGMGAVFEGTHVLLNKRVAIKLLLPELARNQEMSARLMREAQAAGATGHRNIVSITDMGFAEDGTLFMVMEYLSGRTLDEAIAQEGAFSVVRAVALTDQVLAALEVVHRKGIIHRDLKPSNVMLFVDDEGGETVKVLDFGVSKVLGDTSLSKLTTQGQILGTPVYMPPEQARGEADIDHRADIYSCGAILYELLVGKPPLQAEHYVAQIVKVLEGQILAPSQRHSDIPRELDSVVMKALARQPEQRFPDAAAFRRALQPWLTQPRGQTMQGLGGAGLLGERSPAASPAAAPSSTPAAFRRSTLDLVELDRAAAAARDKAPSRASASPVSDADFAPPPDEQRWESLELATPSPRGGGSSPAAPAAVGIHRPVERSRLKGMRLFAALVLALAAAGAGWHYRAALLGWADPTYVSDTVLLLVETEPREAEVYVDGVLAVTKPVELPRSDRVFTVRVQAQGYHSEELEVQASHTRSIHVKLRRREAERRRAR